MGVGAHRRLLTPPPPGNLLGMARFDPSRLAIFALCAASTWSFAGAQTVRLELGAVAPAVANPVPVFGVVFDKVKVEGGALTLDLRYMGTPRLGLGLTTSRAFGPLGNIVIDGWGALAANGSAEGRVGVRGVLGPVALRLALLGFTDEPAAFRPEALASAERAVLSRPAFGVQVGLIARLSRNVILEVEPDVYLAGGVALRGEARLRLLRLLGENELSLIALAYAPPGLGALDAAFGVGLTLPRGRAPDWSFAALLGTSPAGAAVGARASVAEDFGSVRLRLDAAFEPYRLDLAPLRVTLMASVPAAATLGGGTWELSARLASDVGLSSPLRAAVPAAYSAAITLVVPYSRGR